MDRPPYLYKYQPFDMQALRNLKGQIVHFGLPLKFNDPYDCALTPNIKIPTDSEVEAMRGLFLEDPTAQPAVRRAFAVMDVSQLREKLMLIARERFTDWVQTFLKEKGVACFSETNDNLLMWSHYGGQYKGICLEFDSRAELFTKAKRVRYETRMPEIDVTKFVTRHEAELVELLFCTKSKDWSYEREWRLIHVQGGTEYGYPAEALTGVYFGPDIDAKSLEIACLVLQGQNEHVRFYRGSRSPTEFRVDFQPFTYQSYLGAKAAGLRP